MGNAKGKVRKAGGEAIDEILAAIVSLPWPRRALISTQLKNGLRY